MQFEALEKLDAEIEKVAARLETLKQLRDTLRNPDALEALTWLFNPAEAAFAADQDRIPGTITTPQKQKRRRRSGLLEQIKALILDGGNEWASVQEIAAKADLPQITVRDVIYKRASDQFEKKTGPGRSVAFRVKPAEQSA
ncbi:hypothetical protein ETAA8_69550 [Anatilimnocola aggregata]|uniref:Uncharacterized protein n=1 Tax=Anatilimnocola aggregata TaxID=2528021 RepID=A0A517YNJ3_9BACT|nr:hypothetical protein [Anatilimnocola aggregata]QDU31795.1 hypothetical protein ETAA8_69550 [Anatilimnocola aggregata]